MPLEDIRRPQDLGALTYPALDDLAGEIRDFVVQAVAETGGHLGSNLGAVETDPGPASGVSTPRPT